MKACTFILFLLVIAVVVLISTEKPRIVYVQDDRKIKDLEKTIDSLEQQHELLIINYLNLKKSLEISKQEARKARQLYINEKNKPISIYTDAQLDSILTALYR